MMVPSPRILPRADMLRRLFPAAPGVAHVHATNIFWSQVMHITDETTSTLDARPVNVCHDWSARPCTWQGTQLTLPVRCPNGCRCGTTGTAVDCLQVLSAGCERGTA